MKKLLAIVLAVAIVAGMIPATFATDFTDTDGHWAEESIARWAKEGIIDGIGNNEFRPDGTMTRAQAAAVFARLLKLNAKTDVSNFADVDDDAWYAEYIAMCVAAGIIKGVGDGKMDPDGTLTREQMMTMLCRAVGIKPEENSEKNFSDSHKISDWAEGYVNALTNAGIVDGVGSNKVAPNDNINRAGMMSLLDKGIAVYADTAGETVEAEEGATGIVLVAAPNVTVTGEASSVAIVEGAAGGITTITDATVGTVTLAAADTNVVLDGTTTAESIDVAEKAEGSFVKVEETAAAGTVTSDAPETSVKVEGAVEEVKVASTATNTTVDTGNKATVGKVDTSAEGTTVSGNGKVENVTTSGNNTTVQTSGTKVEAAEGTTGTTAGGVAVEGGSSASTPSAPVHYHSYTYASNEGGTHKVICSCGTTTEDCDGEPCSKCGYIDGAEAKIGNTYYASVEEAIEAGGDVTLLSDATITKALVIAEDITLNLNGKTLSVGSIENKDRPFNIEKSDINIIINGTGGTLNYGSDNYGLLEIGNASSSPTAENVNITLNGGAYTGNVGGGAIIRFRTNTSGSVTLNGVEMTDGATGTYGSVIDSKMVDSYAPVSVTVINSTIKTNAGLTVSNGGTITGSTIITRGYAIEAASDVTVTNCEITVGTTQQGNAPATCVAASWGGTATVSNCTLSAASGSKGCLNTYTSSGHIVADKCTFTGTPSKIDTIAPGHDGTPENAESSITITNPTFNVSSEAELEAAIAMGGNITLLNDVVLEDALVVDAGKTVTLDLNGKTISQTKAQEDPDGNGPLSGNYEMILNDGNLTIKDSGTGGKISYTDSGIGGNYISNTITNRGTLTLVSGTVENLSSSTVASNGYPYAIDTSMWGAAAEVNTNIEGGKVLCANYSALRLRADDLTKAVNITISGGEVLGRIEFQNPQSSKASKGTLTITGGVINKNNSSMAIMIFGAGGTGENMIGNITGGTFTGPIGFSSYFGPIAGFNKGIISGGTFDVDPSAYVASGYKVVESNGKWIVSEKLPGEVLTAAEAQEALDNATDGTVIQLIPGVDYGSLKFRANPEHSNTTQIEVANAYAYDYVRSIENITIIGADGAKVDGFIFETGAQPGDWHVTMDIKNLVIDGVEFTDELTASSAGYNAPVFITTSNATIDGLTIKNCKLVGNNEKLNLLYLYGADGAKNVTLTGNTVDGIARLCEIRGTDNVTITGNTIKNTYEHGMLLAGAGYSGNIIITGNTAEGNNDRFVRMAGAGSANIVITGNIITNYMGADDNYIKITNSTATPTIENNTITDGTDGNREFTVTVE